MRITCESKTPSGRAMNLRVIRAILAKHVQRQQQDISVKLLHARHTNQAGERLVAGERVARPVFTSPCCRRRRREKPVRNCATGLLDLAGGAACPEELAPAPVGKNPAARGWPGARARENARPARHLIGQRIEIEHLRVGVDRRNAVLIRFGLHVGENVVALLHLHQRIATLGRFARRREGVQHTP